MSTPTDQLAGLSIQDMSPTSDEVKKRAIELQDILSSFEENVYPSGFQLSIFEYIDRSPAARPSRNAWTELGNLPGTFLRWGCYDDKTWEVLSGIVTPKDRATAFTEKLQRQVNNYFDEYNQLQDMPPTAENLKTQLSRLVSKLIKWSKAVKDDQIIMRMEEAETRESDTLQIALEALQKICIYTLPITPTSSAVGGGSRRTRTRAASLTDQHLSLFGALIKAPSAAKDPFLLETLEAFTGPALRAHKDLLVAISGLLEPIAPRAYTDRFDALQEKANDETSVPKVQAVSSGRKRGLEADPTSTISFEATPKRGKRTGGR